MTGTLRTHLEEVDEQASAMFSRLAEQVTVSEGITEQLKANDQMEWVARMNNIEARSREIVNYELIFTS
ncbi:MAG: TnpV protein [Clostridia bacterium]|nr:TnpV protein [Clostridia bacterium]